MAASVDQWVSYYRMLGELENSWAARQAREIVFGGKQPMVAAATPRITASQEVLKMQRHVWLAGYRMLHPRVSHQAIAKAARVHRSDFYKFLRGQLPEGSVTSQKITWIIHPG